MKNQLKQSPRKWTATRVESWASAGFPDVFLCDEFGCFHTLELKHTFSEKVDLSAHQVSFHAQHSHSSSWILVKREYVNKKGLHLFLYHASQAIDVKLEGLKIDPVFKSENWENWQNIFEFIAPGNGSKNAFFDRIHTE